MPYTTEHTPYVGSIYDSSYGAAITANVQTGRARVLAMLRQAGDGGLTDEQISEQTGLSLNTVRPRRVRLVEDGLVVQSPYKRYTRSDRLATVWVAV